MTLPLITLEASSVSIWETETILLPLLWSVKKSNVKEAFFAVLQQDDKTQLFALLDPHHGRKFYKFCSGPKTIVMRSFHRKNGQPYQPNTVNSRLKLLFAEFILHGIQYSLTKDFKFPGGFAHKLATLWAQANKNDPSFGCRPTKFALPDDYDKIIRKKVKGGAMDYSGDNNAFHLLALFAFSLGTQFGFRGVKVSYYISTAERPKND